jgi:hypothetical protein
MAILLIESPNPLRWCLGRFRLRLYRPYAASAFRREFRDILPPEIDKGFARVFGALNGRPIRKSAALRASGFVGNHTVTKHGSP